VENKTLPLAACRLSAEVADVSKDSAKEGDATKTPVRLVARSTEPVQGWWGAVYHDLAGMQIELPLPLDYCHECDEIVGAAEGKEITDEGLVLSGFLVSLAPLDRADEVVKKSRAGVPYQASIFAEPLSIEEVLSGGTAEVNGETINGPGLIVRQSMLRATAVTPYGRDSNTSVEVALSHKRLPQNFRVPVLNSSQPMSQQPTNAPAVKTAEAAPAQNTAAAAPAAGAAVSQNTSATTTQAVDPRAEFQATLKRFSEKFGPANGAAWAAEGLSYEQALEKHIEALSAEKKTLGDNVAELQTKLGAIPRGEAAPVTFSTNEKHAGGNPAPAASKLQTSAIAKFAATINLPK
jgi:hypothetical protein